MGRLPLATSRTGRACLIVLAALCSFQMLHERLTGLSGSYTVPGSPMLRQGIDLSDPTAPFVAWPLARVCNEAQRTPGLVFVCDNNSGGIGNIRSFTLTCLRYAIAAGTTGLVMPRIQARSEDNLANLFRGYRPFDYYFDEQHFRHSLEVACPGITIYEEVASIPGFRPGSRPEQITPNHFGKRRGCDQRDLNRHADLFGSHLREWLDETAREKALLAIGAPHPRVIRMNWGVQWNYPVYKDGPEFAATFGGLLRFRRDILELGERTAMTMEKFARLETASTSFAGVHLRTESDVLNPWPRFDAQADAYNRRIDGLGLRAVFLATGNATEAGKFKARATAQGGVRIVTKHDLLEGSPSDLEQLRKLSWDQHALIDFVVLLRSTYFVGVSPSSFSITIAGKRHLREEGLYSRPWRVGGEGDGRSWLVGNYAHYWDDWLFMYDSLWP